MLVCCTLSSGPHDIRLTLWQEDPNVSLYLPPLHFLFIFHVAAQVMVLNVTHVRDHVPPWSPLMALQGLGNTSDSLSCLLPSSLCICLSYHLSTPQDALSFLSTLFSLPRSSLSPSPPSLLLPSWPFPAHNPAPLSTWGTHACFVKSGLDSTSSTKSFSTPQINYSCHALFSPTCHVHNSISPTLKIPL